MSTDVIVVSITDTNLAFALPIMEVLAGTSTADIDVRTCSDEHVICRDDISDRRSAGIVSWKPSRNWDVVRGATEGYREKAMDAQQELGPSVVVSCRRAWDMSDGSWQVAAETKLYTSVFGRMVGCRVRTASTWVKTTSGWA